MSKIKTVFFTLLSLGLVAVSICLLPERREPVSMNEKVQERRSRAFSGSVCIWQVTGWRTGGTSMSSLLEIAANAMEKRYPGIFFSVEAMEPSSAREKMERGESPDILSFPGGMVLSGNDKWQDPDISRLKDEYSQVKGFLPWIACDAQIMIRTDGLDLARLAAPSSHWTGAELFELGTVMKTKKRIGLLSPEWNLSPWGWKNEQAEWSQSRCWTAFVEGNANMLVCGPWERINLQWRQQAEKGPNAIILPWPQDTFCPRWVQYLGIRATGDAQKDALLSVFSQYMMQSSMAQKIRKVGCIPTSSEDAAAESQTAVYMLPNRSYADCEALSMEKEAWMAAGYGIASHKACLDDENHVQ